jgi:hypothetical protein
MCVNFVLLENTVRRATDAQWVNIVLAMIRMQRCATIAPRVGLKIKKGKPRACVAVQDATKTMLVEAFVPNAERGGMYPIQQVLAVTIV